jgi:hypothetical protein
VTTNHPSCLRRFRDLDSLCMTADRSELHHLIDGLPDNQVALVLADVRRLADEKPKGTWPPEFFGMLEDGPVNGSSPAYIDELLSQGFGSEP